MSEVLAQAATDFAAGRFGAVLDAALAPVGLNCAPEPGLLCLGGQAAMRLRRPVDAAGLLQAAVNLAPTDQAAWYALGEAWYALRQFLAADHAWANVTDLKSKSPLAPRLRRTARILAGLESMDWPAIASGAESGSSWTPNLAAAVPDPAARVPMLTWLGEARRNEVCVSIDDGPSPDLTPLILSILKARRIPAAFFLIGDSVARHPELVRQILDDGHEIYSHSHTHERFSDLNEEQIVDELSRAEEALSRIRPTPDPYPFRLPGGMGWNKVHVHKAIRRWNTQTILIQWTVDPRDWAAQASLTFHGDPVREAKARLCETALDPALRGGIVLTHDCQMGLPRTSTVFVRQFFEGLADLIDKAHLKPAPLFAGRPAS